MSLAGVEGNVNRKTKTKRHPVPRSEPVSGAMNAIGIAESLQLDKQFFKLGKNEKEGSLADIPKVEKALSEYPKPEEIGALMDNTMKKQARSSP